MMIRLLTGAECEAAEGAFQGETPPVFLSAPGAVPALSIG